MTLSQPRSRRFRSQGRSFPMYRFARTSLMTIGLTSIVLASLTGGRAQSADTDLQPALQQIRDEVRDLRHDVKALRELLEKQSPPVAQASSAEKQPGSPALAGDGAYFVYSHSDVQGQLMTLMMTSMIDHLRGQGYAITKIDVAEHLRRQYGVDLDLISIRPLLILKRGGELQVLRGLQPEDTLRSKVTAYFGERVSGQDKPNPASESKPHDPSLEAYFFYAKWSGPCQQMMPLIDKLRAEGHRIVKVDVDTDKELAKRFNVTVIPTLCIGLGRPEFVPLSGVQTEETIRSWLSPKHLRPELGKVGAGADPVSRERRLAIVDEKLRKAHNQTVRDTKWEAALKRVVSIDCDKLPLRQFVGRLLRAADVAIDTELAETEVDTKAPITLHASGVTLESALKLGLEQAHARYELRDQSLVMLNAEFPTDEKRHQALQRKVTFDCDKISLRAFIDHIWKDWHLGNVVVPMTVNLQAPITMHVCDATLESVLKQGFQQAGVRCKFRDDVFLLAPVDPLVLLAYPVADLLANPEAFSGVVRKETIDFDSLEKLIRTAVEPKSWDGAGGEGRIQHVDKTLCLVIRQTQPVHDQIRDLLQELRKPQQLKITLRSAVLRDCGDILLKASGLGQHADPGQIVAVVGTRQAALLWKVADHSSRLDSHSTLSTAMGIEARIRPVVGEHIWPESVQVLSGQVGGRAYIWFELTGADPETGQPRRAGAMSLSPDFKPVLVRLKRAPEAPREPAFWEQSHTVDQVIGKPSDDRFLLIKPEVEVADPPKGSQREETERLN
jgi:thiol-disulfide isomerase/thioredoxin